MEQMCARSRRACPRSFAEVGLDRFEGFLVSAQSMSTSASMLACPCVVRGVDAPFGCSQARPRICATGECDGVLSAGAGRWGPACRQREHLGAAVVLVDVASLGVDEQDLGIFWANWMTGIRVLMASCGRPLTRK